MFCKTMVSLSKTLVLLKVESAASPAICEAVEGWAGKDSLGTLNAVVAGAPPFCTSVPTQYGEEDKLADHLLTTHII
jgi:hypothetical protein